MLLSGIITALACMITDHTESRIGCALATGVSIVAFYHYSKLVSIREQSGTRITLSKPGDAPEGQAPKLKIAWQEMAADAVRYSDWTVTLAESKLAFPNCESCGLSLEHRTPPPPPRR